MTRPKDPAAVSLGRRGGIATAAKLTPAETAARGSLGGRAAWARRTLEERSAELKRRWEVRRARKTPTTDAE